MLPEEIAQWVINNRFPKSEFEKTSDHEMYYFIVGKIKETNQWMNIKNQYPTDDGIYAVKVSVLSMNGFVEQKPRFTTFKNGKLSGVGASEMKITHWIKLPDLDTGE